MPEFPAALKKLFLLFKKFAVRLQSIPAAAICEFFISTLVLPRIATPSFTRSLCVVFFNIHMFSDPSWIRISQLSFLCLSDMLRRARRRRSCILKFVTSWYNAMQALCAPLFRRKGLRSSSVERMAMRLPSLDARDGISCNSSFINSITRWTPDSVLAILLWVHTSNFTTLNFFHCNYHS